MLWLQGPWAPRLWAAAITVVVFGWAANGEAQLADKKALTLEAAKAILAAAEAEAKTNNWKVVIAVVDDGGRLVALHRMDDSHPISVDVAPGKAKAAALYRRPTKMLEERINQGRTAQVTVPGAIPLEGGLPIVVDGKVIGGVGVSGVLSSDDAKIAQAGISALTR